MRRMSIAAAIVLSLTLSGVAFAKDHGRAEFKRASWDKHDNDRNHDRDRDHVRDHDRDHHSDFRDHHAGPKSTPPGWSKGRKTGWGNCDAPPGQAKKTGCRPVAHTHHVHRASEHPHQAHRPTVRTNNSQPVTAPVQPVAPTARPARAARNR